MISNRRTFLKHAALGSVAVSWSARSWSQVKGANGTIRHAVIGLGSQGRSHVEGFGKVSGARVAALCEVDSDVLNREGKKLNDRGQPAQLFNDVRRMLESKEIDTVSIATPNHWHSLAAIWAIMAGKDVYVEKPVSHNVWEGRQLVNAARKHNAIVQTGTQSRSNPGMQEIMKYLHDGKLGKIKVARGLCYKRRGSIGKVNGPQTPPKGLDYDLWCGPAPLEPLMRTRLHYDWHWVWPTGNGDLGNQGIHQMDLARWALQENELSPHVLSIGGRLGYDDDGTTPNTQLIFHNYKVAPLIFEVRGLPARFLNPAQMDNYRGASVGLVIDCENGYMVIPTYHSGTAFDPAGNVIQKFDGQASHHANFMKAVQSRKKEDLSADILEGHLSSALCHTGNISYRLGEKQNPGEIRERIQGDKLALESFERMAEHLDHNEVSLERTPATLGASLEMDTQKETFKGNADANQLLTRDYRAPYIVPAISAT